MAILGHHFGPSFFDKIGLSTSILDKMIIECYHFGDKIGLSTSILDKMIIEYYHFGDKNRTINEFVIMDFYHRADI